MLYNPKWDVTTEPTLRGYVAWLKTKNPHEEYNYAACDGTCAADQYLISCGLSKASRYALWSQAGQGGIVSTLNSLAGGPGPRTFGALLKRAEAALGHE